MNAPNFLIVDDHPLFLEALQSALELGFPGAKVDVAESIGSARSMLDGKQFSLVLLDLKMPDAVGYEGLQQIRSDCRNNPLAVISAMTGPEIISKVRSVGAEGFIHKSSPRKDIIQSIESMLNGEISFPQTATAAKSGSGEDHGILDRLAQLTPQQFKVLTKVCEAKLNKQIAFELGVTETTIKAHITLIFKKLGVHSRTQAVLLLQRLRPELEGTQFSGLFASEG